jgi:hypothetical protein
VAAQDVWFTDDRGRQILDGHSGLMDLGSGSWPSRGLQGGCGADQYP